MTDTYAFIVHHLTRTSFTVNGRFYRWVEKPNRLIDDSRGPITTVEAPNIAAAIGFAVEDQIALQRMSRDS